MYCETGGYPLQKTALMSEAPAKDDQPPPGVVWAIRFFLNIINFIYI